MDEKELKELAIYHAKALQEKLERIDDEDFIDRIISCVSSNSPIDDELMEDV